MICQMTCPDRTFQLNSPSFWNVKWCFDDGATEAKSQLYTSLSTSPFDQETPITRTYSSNSFCFSNQCQFVSLFGEWWTSIRYLQGKNNAFFCFPFPLYSIMSTHGKKEKIIIFPLSCVWKLKEEKRKKQGFMFKTYSTFSLFPS